MTERMDAASPRLAPIEDDRLDAVEAGVFAGIAQERSAHRRRRRAWTVTGAAAAVVVVAIAIAPSALQVVGGAQSAGSTADAPAFTLNGQAQSGTDFQSDGASGEVAPQPAQDGGGKSAADGSTSSRDIITTATATMRVEDIPAAAARIAEAAKSHGGYTENMVIGQSGAASTSDGNQERVSPAPLPPVSGGSITVRVPADQLDEVVASLTGIGTVEASTVNRQDVTTQAIDLQARVKASQASVERLTQLMAKAGSVSSLLEAEKALSDRQATLESEQQELKALKDQVAMSTLSVTLLPQATAANANPAGFASGLVAGWNTLVASVNGVVVAIGFLLPWLIVAAVIAGIVLAILAIRRRRRRARRAAPMPPTA